MTRFALRLSALLLLGLLSLRAFACAEEAMYSHHYDQCMDQAGGVTAGMLDCLSAEHARQDKQLNDTYRKLMAALPAKRQQRLQVAQRLWLKYRAANCNAYVDPDGGTAESLVAADCELASTAARAAELTKLQPSPR
ncbi:lysozyme inhibitor LprI family protein [Chromobacterium vaccinii]|uniref:lysozyme inhibitor LprI family protein n=1 Tax=Chromobacterium vaccinii TaxID=1108595 RepID=UPI001E41CE6E|nr:lysozyme inhibitor LprI family protein [Chromobacterium vaccinii]MCD4502342.1 lysozyme inhibitor LprI family protein [Chromobacterium vaccinii]